ncbi:Uncharacterised protein [Mycobacteroides abscessus subsp. abscessus]|nr:Uncharacterised protein [Mycobacteroides abscessus subsp. abscessus]
MFAGGFVLRICPFDSGLGTGITVGGAVNP